MGVLVLDYVAFSRVKKINDLYILNFNPKAIKVSHDVEFEMERLNSKLLTVTLPQVISNSGDVCVALLNVRSIAKLPDINQDPVLQSADVVCITETWLTPNHAHPSIK